MQRTNIIFAITQLTPSGAERMAVLLCNALSERDRSVTLLITHQKRCDAYTEILSPKVKSVFLEEELKNHRSRRLTSAIIMLSARTIAKLERVFLHRDKDSYSIRKYLSKNYDKIHWMRGYFRKNKDAAVIAFLYQAIFHTLLSATEQNKVIISERGDPQQCCYSRTNRAFFNEAFPKADTVVLQSEGVKEWYDRHTAVNAAIIYNPLRGDLPEAYGGARDKTVVNFCRFARQKNLTLLIDAFTIFHQSHPEYRLRIIGGPSKDGGREYIEQVHSSAAASGCGDAIQLLPASSQIHKDVLRDGMFVSSSDYEGMSNSMLEAMAIGLPTICTDCPAGGARAVITDHENGLLTPVGDAQALANAMSEVADSPALAQKLSENGVKIKERLAVDKIIRQWLAVIDS